MVRWLGLSALLSIARLANAQNPPDATSVPHSAALDSLARLQPAETVDVDSTLLLDAGARRIGLTTYAVRSEVRGRVGPPDPLRPGAAPRGTTIRYRLNTDWLISSAPGEDFFVRQETRAAVQLQRWLGAVPGRWLVEPFVQHAQNPAIRTAITTLGSRAAWQGRVPGAAPTDSVSRVRVGVLAGLRRDVRRQYADAGPAVGADILAIWLPPNVPGAAPVRVWGRALRATFGPRVFTRLLADAAWEVALPASNPAAGPGAVQLGAGWRVGRTDDYLSGNVQRIASDTLTARLGVVYPLARGLSFRSDNVLGLPGRRFAYRPVTGGDATVGGTAARLRNSSFRQRDVQLRQEVRGQWRRLRGGVQFGYTERQRTYDVQSGRLDSTAAQLTVAARQEQLKDIRERTSAWITDAEWAPVPRRATGPRHVFSTRTTAQILRLDTPSEQNVQDRDEVYYQARTQWAATWDPTFRTTLALAAEFRQFVYIKAAQSAENYTERVVAYEPGFRWQPGRFGWTADVQLRAIYQVRALRSEQGRNRATRLLQWQQEWSYRLGGDGVSGGPSGASGASGRARREWLLTATYQRRESRFAVLSWPEFKEAPLDTTIANDYLLAVRRGLGTRPGRPAGLRHAVRLGYRFFEQRVQQPGGLTLPGEAPRLIYRRDFTWQHGPELRYERTLPARGLQLNAGVWLQRITTFRRYRAGKGLYSGASLTPPDFPSRARRADPYFDVSLVWRWR